MQQNLDVCIYSEILVDACIIVAAVSMPADGMLFVPRLEIRNPREQCSSESDDVESPGVKRNSEQLAFERQGMVTRDN